MALLIDPMPSKRFEQVYEGEWTPWDWRDNEEMCCGCCMVHKVSYRVTDAGKLQRRVAVDRKKTYAARRRTGIKIVRTK